MPGWSRIASAASRPPCTTLKTPSGSPASRSSSAIRPELSGTCSDGFRTKALPSAMALGKRPVRHHRGEVERIDRGHHAERVPLEPAFDAPAHLHHLAHGDLRQRAGELGQLDGLEDLGLGLALDLAVLLRNQRAELGEVALEQGLVAVEDLDPLLDRRRRPGRERAPRGRDRLIHLGGSAQRHAADHGAGGRVQHVQEARAAGDRPARRSSGGRPGTRERPPGPGRARRCGCRGRSRVHPGRGEEEVLEASEGVCPAGSGMSMWCGGQAVAARTSP